MGSFKNYIFALAERLNKDFDEVTEDDIIKDQMENPSIPEESTSTGQEQ